MFQKYVLPFFAVLGFIFALKTAFAGSARPPVGQPLSVPLKPPFEYYVAGAGIIEASTENISIATSKGGLVTEVFVKIGESIPRGAPLFQLDNRELVAQLSVQESAIAVTEAVLVDTREQLQLREKLSDSRAVSTDELRRLRNGVRIAEARRAQAQAELEATQVAREVLTVRSPVAGTVLSVKIRPGEFATAQSTTTPLLILGKIDPLHVRVDIDENDAWRATSGAPGRAQLRGNPDVAFDLEFVTFEPYVIPKRSLTGDSTERVDTRVLQVIYKLPPNVTGVYVGQQMDVYIKAEPRVVAAAEPTAK